MTKLISLRPVAMAALLALSALASGPAQAGIFDDDEARKAILDLRQRLTAAEDAAKKRDADQAAVNQAQTEQLQKSLLDLSNQIEVLRGEVARLRGSNEQLARDLSEVQRRQKDIQQGVDERLRKVEPQKVSVDGKSFQADPEEIRAFEDALSALRGGDFDKSSSALNAFLQRWPSSGYADAARYWLGNALYGKRAYKDAVTVFRAFVTATPDHPRAPEALLALANCQIEAKDGKTAKKTLEELIKTYPKSEAAVAAKERLHALK